MTDLFKYTGKTPVKGYEPGKIYMLELRTRFRGEFLDAHVVIEGPTWRVYPSWEAFFTEWERCK